MNQTNQKIVDVQNALATVTRDMAGLVQRINDCVSLLESVVREGASSGYGAPWAKIQDLEGVIKRQDDTINRMSMIVERHTRELSLRAFVPDKPKAKAKARKGARA